MKIEAEKYYMTRDGRKVGPMKHWDSFMGWHPWADEQNNLYTNEGTSYEGKNPHRDLISETIPEVGTLAEIGAEVGDVVELINEGINSGYNVVTKGKTGYVNLGKSVYISGHGRFTYSYDAVFRIITKAAKPAQVTPQPVRTVTRKEIVPGIYGAVRVVHTFPALGIALVEPDTHADYVGYALLTHDALTAAIETLTQIRDAM